jgi:hypothetical protein
MAINPKLRRQIAERDKYRCRYCLTTEENSGIKMHIDHIIPEAIGGKTTLENLCLACFSCNVNKGAQHEATDPATGEAIPFFHPLQQHWNEHFAWDATNTKIIGLTPCGRTTLEALQMNNQTIVMARKRWVSAGWHPPDL